MNNRRYRLTINRARDSPNPLIRIHPDSDAHKPKLFRSGWKRGTLAYSFTDPKLDSIFEPIRN